MDKYSHVKKFIFNHQMFPIARPRPYCKVLRFLLWHLTLSLCTFPWIPDQWKLNIPIFSCLPSWPSLVDLIPWSEFWFGPISDPAAAVKVSKRVMFGGHFEGESVVEFFSFLVWRLPMSSTLKKWNKKKSALFFLQRYEPISFGHFSL